MNKILCFIGIHKEIIVEQSADMELGIYKYYPYCFFCSTRVGKPLHGGILRLQIGNHVFTSKYNQIRKVFKQHYACAFRTDLNVDTLDCLVYMAQEIEKLYLKKKKKEII